MPAPRLPWFKFWIGATAHTKARALNDGVFRTWVELLDLSAQQKWRGRFASRKEAIDLSRRPAQHLGTLIESGLVDEDVADKHLTMHDWDDWQRWRKEDANDTGTPTDHPPNGHVINPGMTAGTIAERPLEWPTERPRDEHTPSSREDVRLKDVRIKDSVLSSLSSQSPAREEMDERTKDFFSLTNDRSTA